MSQRFHLDHLDKVMEVALNGCKDIANILDKVVRQHVTAATASLDLGGGTWGCKFKVVIGKGNAGARNWSKVCANSMQMC